MKGVGLNSVHFIDAHAHVQDFENPSEIIHQAIQAGIHTIALGGTHSPDWVEQKELQKNFSKNVILHFGLHPWWVEQYTRFELEEILQQLDQELSGAQGLGETGLDFYQSKRNPDRFIDQEWMFREQLKMSKKHHKPVVIHAVHAHDRVLSILSESLQGDCPVILHRFSGTEEQARQYQKKGAYLSFDQARSWMSRLDLNRILLETDSNAKSHPGGWDIRPHYEKTSKIMNLTVAELCQKVAENFRRIGYSLGR